MAFSTFKILCSHNLYLLPKYFYNLQRIISYMPFFFSSLRNIENYWKVFPYVDSESTSVILSMHSLLQMKKTWAGKWSTQWNVLELSNVCMCKHLSNYTLFHSAVCKLYGKIIIIIIKQDVSLSPYRPPSQFPRFLGTQRKCPASAHLEKQEWWDACCSKRGFN